MKNKLTCKKSAPFRVFLCTVMTIAGISASAQTISTIAGTGTAGYSGDGGAAVSAALSHPHGIAIDASGSIFFADHDNSAIRKISPTGVITTIAGNGTAGYSGDGGPASAAKINLPFTVAVDGVGNLYIGDSWNHRVRKVTPSGIISTIAGNGTAGFSGDGGPATAASLDCPSGVAVDAAGNIYIGDFNNHRVRKVNASGVISTFAGNGIGAYSGDGGPAAGASLWLPNFVHLDAGGNLYISDNQNHRIRKVTTAGIISTFAGNGTGGSAGDGGPATSGQLNYPAGVTDDGAGNFFIADFYNNKIRKVSSAGILSAYAGIGTPGFSGDGGPASAAELYKNTDVSFDNAGRLVIVDYGNHRIRRIGGATNNAPVFTGGRLQSLDICVNEATALVPVNSLLAVADTDAGQTETWSVVSAPAHGTLVATYSMVSTGSVIVPVGLSYTPISGYIGTDAFSVSVTDGIATDTTTVNISINPYAVAGSISGADSVCPGDSIALSASVSGGIWSSSNPSIASVNSLGRVAGLIPGNDTIIYTVINSCGVASVIFPFHVRSYSACHTGVRATLPESGSGLVISPNPGSGVFEFEINTKAEEEIKYTVFNALGQKIKTFEVVSNQRQKIDLTGLPTGIYCISATNGNMQLTTRLVVY